MENLDPFTPSDIERLAGELEGKFYVDEADVIRKFSEIAPPSVPTVTAVHPVHLSPVSTFIQGSKDGRFGYIVSSIAKHWGVLVGDSEKFLYHLVFEDQADAVSHANPNSLTGRVRAVKFSSTDWDPSRDVSSSATKVGDTRYSPTELLRIGNVYRIVLFIGRKNYDQGIR